MTRETQTNQNTKINVMKKSLTIICPVLLTILVLGSCQKEMQVSEITVEPAELTLAEGDQAQIVVTTVPAEAANNIRIKNSDETVAKIDESFKIYALKEGESSISFTAGGKTSTCHVKVSAPELGISPSLNNLVFDAAAPETYRFEITGNIKKWDVECDAEWCIISKDEKGFSITAKPTISREDKPETTITIKSDLAADPIEITARQNGLKIYLAGDDNHRATYWMNGESYRITESSATYVTGIYATKDGKVSVVGRSGSVKSLGFYWDKETGIFNLNTKDNSSGTAFGVFVDESTGDIYFTDHEGWMIDEQTQTYIARLWKNFVPTDMTDYGLVSQAGDVNINNGNIYVMIQNGTENYYLKNDEKIILENYNDDIRPSSMYIAGDDVYIGGYYSGADNFSPCYWKNGKITVLESDQSAQVYGIYVDEEENVYLAGSYGSGLDRAAAYWINGEMTLLTEQNNCCLSGIAAIDGNIICGGTSTDSKGISHVTCWINGEEWQMSDDNSSCFVEAMFIR